jgi:hypothetical protein
MQTVLGGMGKCKRLKTPRMSIFRTTLLWFQRLKTGIFPTAPDLDRPSFRLVESPEQTFSTGATDLWLQLPPFIRFKALAGACFA